MESLTNFSLTKYQHRKIIGYLGLSLPILLLVSTALFGCHKIQASISDYYHTIARDIYIGIIVLISFFFYSYRGYKGDQIAFKIAAISILLVAYFPTIVDYEGGANCLEFMDTNRSFTISRYIHNTSATIFFSTLTYICLFLFTNPRYSNSQFKEAKLRRLLIKTCGFIMLISVLFIIAFFVFSLHKFEGVKNLKLVFYLEVTALVAFSFAWLVKGRFIRSLENNTPL